MASKIEMETTLKGHFPGSTTNPPLLSIQSRTDFSCGMLPLMQSCTERRVGTSEEKVSSYPMAAQTQKSVLFIPFGRMENKAPFCHHGVGEKLSYILLFLQSGAATCFVKCFLRVPQAVGIYWGGIQWPRK